MKKSTLSFVIATAIASFATNANASTIPAWKTQGETPANAWKYAGEKPANTEWKYAGEKPAAPVATPAAVPAAPVATPHLLAPHAVPAAAPTKLATVTAPTLVAPHAVPAAIPTASASVTAPTTFAPYAVPAAVPTKLTVSAEPTRAPVATPAAVPTPKAEVVAPTVVAPHGIAPVAAPTQIAHFKEPQNVVIPTVIAPQAAPTATPVSTGYREPQNVVIPTVIAPQAAPTATPISTGYREPQNVAIPTVIAPQAAPTATPVSTGYREPQNVAIPTVIAPQAAPTLAKVPAQTVPATPEARRPVNVAAYNAPLPVHAPVAAAPVALAAPARAPYQAPVGKEIAGTGYKGEVQEEIVLTTRAPVEAAPVEVVREERTVETARATGLFGQPGTAPTNQATDYDVVQDQQMQTLAAMANSGINKTQTNAQGINTVNTVAQQAVNNTHVLSGALNTTAAKVNGLTNQVAANTQGIQTVQSTLQAGTYETVADYQAGQKVQDDAHAAEVARATAAEQANATAIATETTRATTEEKRIDAAKVEKSDFQKRSAEVDQRIAQHKAEQEKVNKAVAGKLDNHEDRIQTLEANKGYGSKFDALKRSVERNRKIAGAGVSGAMAQANIPQVLQGQSFAVGAAVGGYDSQNALAVGFSARASENVTIKASVSTDSASNFGYGAGVSVGW